jgi:hypothetical protein
LADGLHVVEMDSEEGVGNYFLGVYGMALEYGMEG